MRSMTSCGDSIYWAQLREVEGALHTLEKYGLTRVPDPYQALHAIRRNILDSLGLGIPRVPILLKWLIGFSPGIFAIWYDPDFGWTSEARASPGARPVYHRVDGDTAMAIYQRRLTPELEARLLKPHEYHGE